MMFPLLADLARSECEKLVGRIGAGIAKASGQ